MKTKIKLAFISVLIFFPALVFAQGKVTVEELLEGYLKNDLTLKQLSSNLEKQRLSSQITSLNNGFDIQLSTGTVTIRGGETTSVSLRPSATASVPQAANLGLSVSSSVSVKDDAASVSDTAISLSADIISGKTGERKVTVLKSERQVLEAERRLRSGYLNAEKQFYSELKSLYNAASSILNAQKTLYEDKISFDQIVAQGYSSSSSRYRTSYMKVLSDEHSVETAERELVRKVTLFASKCGVEYNEQNALDFLPDVIPQVEAVDVLSFDRETYTEIESAKWNQYINSLSRAAGGDFSLSAGAGFTFDNSQTKSDTVDAQARVSIGSAASVSAGVSVPLTASPAPVVTMSLSVNPFGFKKSSLENQIDRISIEQEEYDLLSAQNSYDNAVVNQQSSLQDILWSKETNLQTYQMYSSLAKDTLGWFRQGIVNESEYRSSVVNEETYRLKCLMNDIDLIVYNNETQLLFCNDGE